MPQPSSLSHKNWKFFFSLSRALPAHWHARPSLGFGYPQMCIAFPSSSSSSSYTHSHCTAQQSLKKVAQENMLDVGQKKNWIYGREERENAATCNIKCVCSKALCVHVHIRIFILLMAKQCHCPRALFHRPLPTILTRATSGICLFDAYFWGAAITPNCLFCI